MAILTLAVVTVSAKTAMYSFVIVVVGVRGTITIAESVNISIAFVLCRNTHLKSRGD